MAKKREKIDTSSEPRPLQDTPFAALLEHTATVPPPAVAPSPPITASPSLAFTMTRTRKGGFPIHLEKRAGGKCVTVVGGLSGDLPPLLKNLRKLCGSGGVLRDEGLELQGDHCEKLETFFKNNAKHTDSHHG